MYFTDSHIHLQDYATAEAKKVVSEARKANVMEFAVPSTSPDDWQKVVDLSKKIQGVTAAIGVHPWCVESSEFSKLEELEKFLRKYPKLWVGECGIDRIKNPDIRKQHEFFARQIELANKYDRALIIHAVKADEEIGKYFSVLPKRTIFHSFTGSAEWGKKIQKAGFYLGLNFSFFQKENYAEMLQQFDLNKILLETDAPYQPNKGYIGNIPKNLPLLVSAMAATGKLSEIEISAVLAQNWKNFNRV